MLGWILECSLLENKMIRAFNELGGSDGGQGDSLQSLWPFLELYKPQ